MLTPRSNFAARHTVALLFSVCLLIGGSNTIVEAQQPGAIAEDTARGIKLYQQGDTTGAIKILSEIVKKRDDDADAWYFLGLAYHHEGATCLAAGAFEKVVTLRREFVDAYVKLALDSIPGRNHLLAMAMAQRALELGENSAEMHYVIGEAYLREGQHAKALEEAETALKLKPELSPVFVLKSFAQLGLKQYQEAAESMERFLTLSPNDSDAATWRGQIEGLRAAAHSDDKPNAKGTVFSPKDVTIKARILSRPEPQYTEEARKACVEGTVVLRGVISDEGTLKNIRIMKALGYGLTTKSVEAARAIKFTPASIDGRPVSQYIQIEYNFNLF